MGAANGKASSDDDRLRESALRDIDEIRKLARLRGEELEWVDTERGGWWAQHARVVHIQACVMRPEDLVLVAHKLIEALELDPEQTHFTPQRQADLALQMLHARYDAPHPLKKHLDRLPSPWRGSARLRSILLYYSYVVHVVCDTVLRLLACVRRGYSPLPGTTLLDQMRVIVRDMALPFPLGQNLLAEALTISRLARRQHGNPQELVLVLSAWNWSMFEEYLFGSNLRIPSRNEDPMNAGFFDTGEVSNPAQPPSDLDAILRELVTAARERRPLPEERIADDAAEPPPPEQESLTLSQWVQHWLKLGGQSLTRVGQKLVLDLNDAKLVHLALVFLAFHGLPRASARFDDENYLGWTNTTEVELSDFSPGGPTPQQFAEWPGFRERLENELGHGPAGARDMLYNAELACVWSPAGLAQVATEEIAVFCTHVARVAFVSMAGAMAPHFFAQNSRDIAIFVTSMLDEVRKQVPGATFALRSQLISDATYEGWKMHLRKTVQGTDREAVSVLRRRDGQAVLYNGELADGPNYYDHTRLQWLPERPDPRYAEYHREAPEGLARGTSSTVTPSLTRWPRRDVTWSDYAHAWVRMRDQAQTEETAWRHDEQVAARTRRAQMLEEEEVETDEIARLREDIRGWKAWLRNPGPQADVADMQRRLEESERRLAERLEERRGAVRALQRARARAATAQPAEWEDALRQNVRPTEAERNQRLQTMRRAAEAAAAAAAAPAEATAAAAEPQPNAAAAADAPAEQKGWFSFWF